MPSSPTLSSIEFPTKSSDGNRTFYWRPMSSSPLVGLPILDLTTDTYDLLWAIRHAHVPENKGPWPAGMYVWDMAWAFTCLVETHGNVETHFHLEIVTGMGKPTGLRSRVLWVFNGYITTWQAYFLVFQSMFFSSYLIIVCHCVTPWCNQIWSCTFKTSDTLDHCT